MINLTIAPQYAARLAGHQNELHVLVRAVWSGDHFDANNSEERPPLNLCIVIEPLNLHERTTAS